jgi:hypothetical protein
VLLLLLPWRQQVGAKLLGQALPREQVCQGGAATWSTSGAAAGPCWPTCCAGHQVGHLVGKVV